MLGEHQEGLGTGLAGDDAPMQGAMLVTAKCVTILVHMHQDVLAATAAHHFLSPPARDPLRRLIPKHNPALGAGYVRAVGQQVQQFRGVKFCQEGNGIAA